MKIVLEEKHIKTTLTLLEGDDIELDRSSTEYSNITIKKLKVSSNNVINSIKRLDLSKNFDIKFDDIKISNDRGKYTIIFGSKTMIGESIYR